MADTIRVLIADDHAIVRKGIRALLATEPDIAVVGEAEDGLQAVAEAGRLRPDVVLMDLVMPGMDGIRATAEISAALPDTRILVLTSFSSDDQVLPALKAGARGYLLKVADPEEVVDAIHRLHRGESWLHPAVARKLMDEVVRAGVPAGGIGDAPQAEALTEREVDVLRLVAQGQSNREIAAALFISEATARTHVSNILGKLHLASRTQAALYALREGLASLDDEAQRG
ncbi:MAG: response regulator [Anaerolineae bacterium]